MRPSEADRVLTDKLQNGLKMLDINVADHIILSYNDYLSFRDEGLF
ncbi:MAG: hypothetical protein IPG85_11985 [Bacteroidetes bacterium]|nr:hypothetical protein [Bacteroidota bacterium]